MPESVNTEGATAVVEKSQEPELRHVNTETPLAHGRRRLSVHPITEQRFGKGVKLEADKTYDDPKQQERQDVRAFTKSTEAGRSQRQELATSIREKRRERDASSQSYATIHAQREQVAQDANQKQEEMEQMQSQLELSQLELKRKEGSLVGRTLGGGRIKELNTQIQSLQNQISDSESILPQARQQIAEMHSQLQQLQVAKERVNASSKESLQKFMKEKNWELSKAKDINKLEQFKDNYGTVEALAKTGEYVVHAINAGIKRGQNNSIYQGESWKDKLAVAVELKPTISASSIKKGLHAATWFPFGIVLKAGRVEESSFGDTNTTARGLTERSTQLDVSGNVEDYIRKLGSHKKAGYNELVTSNPEAAGMFINLDQANPNINSTGLRYSNYEGNHELLYEEIFTEAQRYGMKVFAFKEGVAHETSIDEKGRLFLGKEVSPQEMTNEGYKVPEENKNSIHEQALKAVPSAKNLNQAA